MIPAGWGGGEFNFCPACGGLLELRPTPSKAKRTEMLMRVARLKRVRLHVKPQEAPRRRIRADYYITDTLARAEQFQEYNEITFRLPVCLEIPITSIGGIKIECLYSLND